MSLLLLSVHKKPTAAAGGVAPTRVQIKSNLVSAGSPSQSLTFDSSVTNGNLVVIGIAGFVNDSTGNFTAGMLTKTAGTSTVGTITLDIRQTRTDGIDGNQVALYSVPVTGTGTLTLTFDCSSLTAQAFLAMGGAEYSGADVSGTRLAATNSANTSTNTTVASGNVATGGAGIIVGIMTPGNPYGAITNTPDGAFSEIYTVEDDSAENGGMIERRVSSNTTDSADWSISTSSSWVAIAAAYKSSSP